MTLRAVKVKLCRIEQLLSKCKLKNLHNVWRFDGGLFPNIVFDVNPINRISRFFNED